VVEELELHQVLPPDEPPEDEGCIVAEALHPGDPLTPKGPPTRVGEAEDLRVELHRAGNVCGAEGDLGESRRHPNLTRARPGAPQG
jgi:hypothetical protein